MKKCPRRIPVFMHRENGIRIPLNRVARRQLHAEGRKVPEGGERETDDERRVRRNVALRWRSLRYGRLQNLMGGGRF